MHDYEKEHLERLRQYLAECTVLLKKDGSFPLCGPCEIAAYGPGVRHTAKGGTGSGEVNSRFFVNIEEGLREAGFTVTSDAWLDRYDAVYEKARRNHIGSLKREAYKNRTLAVAEGMGAPVPEPEYYFPLDAEGDTAVYVLRRVSGEGSDRSEDDLHLTQTEIRDILSINCRYQKFMLVINTGGYVDLSPVAHVKNILVLSQPGVEAGHLLADLLLGKAVPSGKLTRTWCDREDEYKDTEFGNRDDTRYKEGIYVGYRYSDTAKTEPRYPFGYGLGYTEFSVMQNSFRQNGEWIEVSCSVKNTGNFKGREVIQLYVSSPLCEKNQPYQALAAFAKTKELAPGEETELTLRFMMRDLAVYDEEKERYVLYRGKYLLRLGTSSRDTELIGAFCLEHEAVTQKALRSFEKPDFEDLVLPEAEREDTDRMIMVDTSCIETKELYALNEAIDEELIGLDDRDLMHTNIGSYGTNTLSIIGAAGKSVAGAAGETAYLKKGGFPLLVMADGPAGLRLSRQYFEDRKGRIHALGSAFPETVSELLPAPAVKILDGMMKKPGKRDTVREQYATAIPVGTAIAQSFNTELAEMCGDIVGKEMERFHVDLWLAPALNIQRDVRCGRNFEYFSEDPLLSGLMAAAVARGVQKHPGKGVTLKHYAANNQETNRTASNSMVSERALREIYLRAFEIAVREGNPAAVMTSYNLIDGVHASEHKGLLINVLRRQFGFDGIVMTDWVTAGFLYDRNAAYPAPDAAKVAAATNDLFMPGSPHEYRQIEEGLKKGTVTRAQLLANASRIRRTYEKMNGK